ncbi:MAG: MFS transporter, partial [Pseudomonadota bacterium]
MSAGAVGLSPDRSETRLATRLAFFAAGFVLGCWSPLIPYVKQRLGLDDAGLGLLLLGLGAGSVVAMPLAGIACTQFGTRKVTVAGGLGLALLFPGVGFIGSLWAMGVLVVLIGIFLGMLEVGMNSHAVEVERGSAKPLMSGFHALFSIGGFAGAGGATVLLSSGVTPGITAGACAALALGAILVSWPMLLKAEPASEANAFVVPRSGD